MLVAQYTCIAPKALDYTKVMDHFLNCNPVIAECQRTRLWPKYDAGEPDPIFQQATISLHTGMGGGGHSWPVNLVPLRQLFNRCDLAILQQAAGTGDLWDDLYGEALKAGSVREHALMSLTQGISVPAHEYAFAHAFRALLDHPGWRYRPYLHWRTSPDGALTVTLSAREMGSSSVTTGAEHFLELVQSRLMETAPDHWHGEIHHLLKAWWGSSPSGRLPRRPNFQDVGISDLYKPGYKPPAPPPPPEPAKPSHERVAAVFGKLNLHADTFSFED